ncbi:protein PAXX isoform X1 [Hypanus sabinus]|uniref:protein PAXX isoform X1 n=1 Tax=Hypanus sabinus TaxID=79690 RepID=UPI0028C45CDF|nr:protein PAXX isoform X1 [Hypanus sabinus]XP_059850283.1 protein PAXX isoform X1 [Hypanus sabinus]XP_059850284.1 protein PAXX isoform X1 [Hypanus sabinus]XP_059850285.1 protein PAXX isoform X1 [Hypanus sabinus]
MDNQECQSRVRCFHIHRLPRNHQRYLCYTLPGPHIFNLCVTNVVDVWSTAFSQQKLEEHKSAHGIKTTEEYHTRTREAFLKDAVHLTVLDNTIILKLSQDGQDLIFDLYKLPISEAKTEIQSVMFHLVDQVHNLQKQIKAFEESNALNLGNMMQRTQRMFLTAEFDSKMKNNEPGSSTVARKRLAGESLINPGRKRNKAPTGVSFEDNSLDESE